MLFAGVLLVVLMCCSNASQIPAGHCPHDEAPAAVHWCLTEWIASVEEGRPVSLIVGEEAVIKSEVVSKAWTPSTLCMCSYLHNFFPTGGWYRVEGTVAAV